MTARRKTLRTRLLITTAVAVGLLLTSLGVALYLIVSRNLWTEFDQYLTTKARTLAAMVELDDDAIELEYDRTGLPEYLPSPQAEYFELYNAEGQTLYRSASLEDKELPPPTATPQNKLAFNWITLPDGRPGRTATLTFTPRSEQNVERQHDEEQDDDEDRNYRDHSDDDHQSQNAPTANQNTLTITVARGTAHTQATLIKFRLLLISGFLTATILAILVLRIVVTQGLRPLNLVARRINDITESNLSTRIDTTDTPDELTPVVARLNSLLERLETAFEREKSFTSDVAHELRTPLAGIRATLEVSLSRDRNTEDYKQAIETCFDQCCQMQRLTEHLLELTRCESGQEQTATENLDLSQLLKERWQQFEPEANRRNLQIEMNIPATCHLQTDAHKIQLVIDNLLDNAVTYTNQHGHVEINLTQSQAFSTGPQTTTLCISNTGCTINPADAALVFNRFWRADTSRSNQSGPNTNSPKHYGLGLSLCRRITELLKGTISAETTATGQFKVTLTLIK